MVVVGRMDKMVPLIVSAVDPGLAYFAMFFSGGGSVSAHPRVVSMASLKPQA